MPEETSEYIHQLQRESIEIALRHMQAAQAELPDEQNGHWEAEDLFEQDKLAAVLKAMDHTEHAPVSSIEDSIDAEFGWMK